MTIFDDVYDVIQSVEVSHHSVLSIEGDLLSDVELRKVLINFVNVHACSFFNKFLPRLDRMNWGRFKILRKSLNVFYINMAIKEKSPP